ncbi:MAG TPA: hypothetical protein DGH68_12365 [Bacteroidetes bacterium]|jgi:hypothetical protein|nr:hypothetical protein [Bacteroidota bacterium]
MGKRLLLLWLVSEIIFLASLFAFGHEEVSTIAVISYSIQWLLFLLCAMIFRHEPIRKNKFIFLNFSVFFSVSILFHIYNFLGDRFARMYFNQYVSFGVYFFLLAFALVYLSIDALFRDFKVLYKYVLAVTIVGGCFLYYYHGYFENPKYLYSTNDAKTFKAIDEARNAYLKQNGTEPTVDVLAQTADLKLWKDGIPIGTLYPHERVRVVTEFYPYLFGSNYIVLLWRPLYLNTIYMCVLSIGFILLFFGYQYMKDPPQGAYIDKIMFLFLVFCTMEIMHAWSFIKSVEWQTFYELVNIGYAVSLFLLLLIGVFFALRLRFIRSVRGEFYEQEISVSPANVTRWRDALDDLLVAHFFNRKAIVGRLFVRQKT